jgi:acetyltransferase
METKAPRYPFELVDVWRAPRGERLLIRPVHPQDAPLATAFVAGLSPASRYNRFHGAVSALTPERARWATDVDYERHMALIVEAFEGGREIEIGAARYVLRADGETADLAIAIADAWQGQGIGARLLERLMAVAAARGVRVLEGDVLASNGSMLALARKLGFSVRRHREGERLRRIVRDPAVPVRPLSAAQRFMRGLVQSFSHAAGT